MFDSIRKFMIGRYGFDKLGQALAITSAVLMILSGFFGSVCIALAYTLLFWCIFRILSKNTVYRMNENRKYMELMFKIKAYLKRDRRYYRYFKCPNCRKVTKVPKKKGKIAISCPHCRYEFVKKT
ncbi:MAG: hypothetical protein UIM24_03770 [Clostridia bacterium]|nr:hypothetical protein [Clostridia bacterium]